MRSRGSHAARNIRSWFHEYALSWPSKSHHDKSRLVPRQITTRLM